MKILYSTIPLISNCYHNSWIHDTPSSNPSIRENLGSYIKYLIEDGLDMHFRIFENVFDDNNVLKYTNEVDPAIIKKIIILL